MILAGQSGDRSRTWLQLWTAIGILAIVVLAVLHTIELDGPGEQQLLILLTGSILPLIGLWLPFMGKWPDRGDLGAWAPLFLGARSVAYSLSSIAFLRTSSWGATEARLATPADMLGAGSVLCLAIAALFWPSRPVEKSAIGRIVADGAVIFMGLACFAWVILIAPLMRGEHRLSEAAAALRIAYPLGDMLVLVFFGMAIWRGVPNGQRIAAALFGFSAISAIVAHTLFLLQMTGAVGVASEIWVIVLPASCATGNLAGGWLKYSLANYPRPDRVDDAPWSRPGAGRMALALPVLFVPLCAMLLTYAVRAYQVRDARFVVQGLFVLVFMFLAAIIAHQLLTIFENGHLYDTLNRSFLEVKRAQLKLEEHTAQLEQANTRLARVALTDGQTGLPNHRAFQEELERIQRSADETVGLLLLDLDYFKQYNEEFGHHDGDFALREVAKSLQRALPDASTLARFGGDQFAVVLRSLGAERLDAWADRLRRAVLEADVDHRALSASVGFSAWPTTMTSEEALGQALDALDRAKSIGKNMIAGGASEPHEDMELWGEGLALGQTVIRGIACEPDAVTQEPSAPLAGGLLASLEKADPDTRRHSERVMWYALYFADQLRDRGVALNRRDLRSLAYGALLHDIGKIRYPTKVLRSARELDREWREKMQQHTAKGADIVQPFKDLHVALEVVQFHHEMWDGSGYPYRLAQEEIPLVARIFALVDAVDAMQSNRAYSPAKDWEDIQAELRTQAGRHFDPSLVEAFLEISPKAWEALRSKRFRVAGAKVSA